MAATVTLADPPILQVNGRIKEAYVNIAGDNSYPTNGWAIDFNAALGFKQVLFVEVPSVGNGGHVPWWDYTNNKLKMFWCAGAGAAMTEVTNGTNLSTTTLRCVVRGL